MIRWFAKNDIATNLIMIGIVLAGFYIVLPRMPVEINPTYPARSITVHFRVMGITPLEMERSVVKPVETRLNDVAGIDSISAKISYSRATFEIEAESGVNLHDLKSEIESAVDKLPSLPEGAWKPIIRIPDPSKYKEVISVMVTGDLSQQGLTTAARQVRDDLMSTPGISYVKVQGLRSRILKVEPTLEDLRTHQLTIAQIAKAIGDNSINLTAGKINNNAKGVNVMAKNQAVTKEDFENIKIRTVDGAELLVKDVAAVTNREDEEDKVILCNGKPCIRVEVMRLPHESALKVADKVKDYVANAKDRFPDTLELLVWDDESIGLRSRISILRENLIQGAVLVIFTLTLFLRPSLSFFVVMGVPISFAGGLILMHLMGVSINMWTLFGFIIVLGIVVDDAIVTAENVHSKLESNTSRLDAVVDGTKEVATPVTFGVITTMVAFVPLMFIPGHFGNISKQIPLVIIPVLIFSLIESKFILPGHLKHNYHFFQKLNPFPIIHRYVNAGLAFVIEKMYRPSLQFCVYFRWPVVAAFATILVMTFSYVTGPHFKINKVPAVERPMIMVSLIMETDADIAQTHEKVLEIAAHRETLAREFLDGDTGKSLIGNLFTSSGGQAHRSRPTPHTGYLYLEVTPPSQRDKKVEKFVTNEKIASRWKELIGEIEGAVRISVQGVKHRSRAFDEEAQIEFEIRGEDDEKRIQLAEEIQTWIRDQEWAGSATYQKPRPSKELHFKVNENGAAAGLTDKDLANQVRGQILGQMAQRFQHGEDEIRVYVHLPDNERENQQTLNSMRIKTKGGTETSFRSVAKLTESVSASIIYREDRSRIATMKASTTREEKDRLDQHVEAIRSKMNELMADFPGINWRFVGQVARNEETEQIMRVGFFSLIFILFSLLAIPFKSIIQPFFVMLAVPLGIVGALLGHYHMGVTLSYLSIFGVLALAGVVVNDSLVIVDFINRKKQAGAALKEAIIEAGMTRFRPIMLTSITTFAGLYPIMAETSVEALFLRPMAISLGFGIVYATLITLLLIPCAYLISEDIKKYFLWFFLGWRR